MHIDYCREFIELARCLNYTEAAEKLHIAQPTLSKHIVSLEREFGAELFCRSRHGVQLSEAGRVLFGCALDMVDAYDRARNGISSVVRERPIRIDGVLFDSTVASVISLSTALLNDREHTPILFEHNQDRPPFEQLANDEVDMVFAYDDEHVLEERGFSFRPLVRVQFVAVVDRSHPLASREELRMADLADETFIQFVDEYSASGWRRIEQVCLAHGFTPRKRAILGRTPTSYVSTPPNGDVLILQRNMHQLKFLEDVQQTVSIPLVDDDAYFVIYYVYKQENEPRLRSLIEALEESNRIIKHHRPTEK